jgi:hypothetical protein
MTINELRPIDQRKNGLTLHLGAAAEIAASRLGRLI